jgi:5-methylcytosine-specific restriction endonuclease McrA
MVPGWDRANQGKFYQTSAWRNLRALHMATNPLCAVCLATNQRPLTMQRMTVDHIIRIQAGGAAFDLKNLWTLCQEHNARKTALEAHGLELESRGEAGAKYPTKKAIQYLIEKISNA